MFFKQNIFINSFQVGIKPFVCADQASMQHSRWKLFRLLVQCNQIWQNIAILEIFLKYLANFGGFVKILNLHSPRKISLL